MTPLRLELLGAPLIRQGDSPPISFPTTKSQALLIYLAVTQREHTRDSLAALLWGDMPDQQAKKNLRNALYTLRISVGSHIAVSRQLVAFDCHQPYYLDVEAFTAIFAAPKTVINGNKVIDILSLYHADFLSGFHVRDAPEFEDWALLERERLRALAIDQLLDLAQRCADQQRYEAGLEAVQRVLALDSWRETAHQLRMVLFASTGQRAAALVQYDTCRAILNEELDTQPMEETTALYEQIKSGAFRAQRPSNGLLSSATAEPQVDWSEFPRRQPFSGREAELAQLDQWLVVDGVPLIGIFGLPGQGKTVLAAQLVWRLIEGQIPFGGIPPFEHILWRSLNNAPPFRLLVEGWLQGLSDEQTTAMPDQLGEQLAVLFAKLQQRRCLLVLDHVEDIIEPNGAGSWRPGYEAYGALIHQFGQRVHQSCLVIVSRVQPQGFTSQNNESGAGRMLQLRGLDEAAVTQLLDRAAVGLNPQQADALMRRFGGHPLALVRAATTMREFFAADINAFLAEDSLTAEDLTSALATQFKALTPAARKFLRWLATQSEPVSIQTVPNHPDRPVSQRALLEALHGLQRRSLLDLEPQGFRIPEVVLSYLTHSDPNKRRGRAK